MAKSWAILLPSTSTVEACGNLSSLWTLEKVIFPGPKKSLVMIRTSVKKGEKVNDSEELITYVEIPVEEATELEETNEEVEVQEEVAEESKEEVNE